MQITPELQELLSRWERTGRPAADQVCRDCPERLADFQQAVAAIVALEKSAASSRDGTTDSTNNPRESGKPIPGDIAEGSDETPVAATTSFRLADCVEGQPVAPRRAGRYVLDRCLGRGAFGEVWKGYDPVLDLTVAVKMPRADRYFSQREVDLFVDEARKQASLNHPAIVKVRHAERHEHGWLIVSDFVSGATLREYLATNRPTPAESAQIVASIADALHAAHRQRLIHRDVKPGNILIDDAGQPYLTDFGLALAEGEQQGEKHNVAGTFAYMSPEQIRGEAHFLDGRTDIYSLGVVLYEMLAGELPFKGASYADYREQILHRPPKPPRAVHNAIPKELERICLKCLCKSAGDRYSTAADLANDLRTAVRRRAPLQWWVAALIPLACVAALLAYRPWQAPSPSERNPRVENHTDAKPMVVQPTVQPISADGWQPLWRTLPEKLVWPTQNSGALLELKDAEESIWIVCDRDGLLKFTDVQEPSFKLRLRLHPLDWNGTIGVILGYHYTMQQGQERARFQLLRISPAMPKREVQHFVFHSSVTYSPAFGGYPTGDHVKSALIDNPPARGCLLEIEVVDDRLDSVRWDGKALPTLRQEAPADPKLVPTWQGSVGLYVRNCAVRIHRPELYVTPRKS